MRSGFRVKKSALQVSHYNRVNALGGNAFHRQVFLLSGSRSANVFAI
jgi:hypothetical protein